MKQILFTAAVVHNTDVNPTSFLAISSFHGTATSWNLKVPTFGTVEPRDDPDILLKDKKLKRLSEDFKEVPSA